MARTVYLNIGSNLGDKATNIYNAIRLIEQYFMTECNLSRIMESEPWGFESTNNFMNIGISFCSDIDPHELLRVVKSIEKDLGSSNHRTETGEFADRIVDIDIIDIDGVKVNTPTLTIPHAELDKRDFFLIPLRELKGEL